MRIDNASDLIYYTYYMIDWRKVKQEDSDVRCADCGLPMKKSEPALDGAGRKYDGYVCHKDKRLIWLRAS